MKKEQVKTFIKEHKTEIIAGVVTVVVGGCMYAIGRRDGVNTVIECLTKEAARMKRVLDSGNMKPGFATDMLTIADIGKLGEEFLKHDDTLTSDTKILKVGSFIFE